MSLCGLPHPALNRRERERGVEVAAQTSGALEIERCCCVLQALPEHVVERVVLSIDVGHYPPHQGHVLIAVCAPHAWTQALAYIELNAGRAIGARIAEGARTRTQRHHAVDQFHRLTSGRGAPVRPEVERAVILARLRQADPRPRVGNIDPYERVLLV